MQHGATISARRAQANVNTGRILGGILLVLALLLSMAAVAGSALYVRQAQMVLPGVWGVRLI